MMNSALETRSPSAPTPEYTPDLNIPPEFNFVLEGSWPLHEMILAPKDQQTKAALADEPTSWPKGNYNEHKYVQGSSRYLVEGVRAGSKGVGHNTEMSFGKRAWDTKLGRMVYLKFLKMENFQYGDYKQGRELMNKEAVLEERLSGGVKILDYFESDEVPLEFLGGNDRYPTPIIVMEYISPEEELPLNFVLNELKNTESILDIQTIASIIKQAASILDENAVKFMPDEVVHRDLKPGNMFVSPDKTRVIDYGLAKGLRDDPPGYAMGTPEYLSPEQAMAMPDVSHLSDIYSLAVVALELLTKINLHRGAGTDSVSKLEKLRKAASYKDASEVEEYINTRFPIRNDVPGIDPLSVQRQKLIDVFMKGLSTFTSERYQTATDFANDLEGALAPFLEEDLKSQEKWTSFQLLFQRIRELFQPK